MAASSENAVHAIRKVRDRALLLGLGKDYLCEPPFLRKYGKELRNALATLQDEIHALKKKFPGRFAQEVDTDQIVDGMLGLTHRLEEADAEIRGQCTAGRVGEDLEVRLKSLSDAIQGVRQKVEGETGGYSGTDAVAGAFVKAGGAFWGGLGLAIKAAGFILLLGIGVFFFLFFTMEKDDKFIHIIQDNQAQVRGLQDDLSRIEGRLIPLQDRLKFMENRALTREEKLRYMELQLELEKLEARVRSTEGEIDRRQGTIGKAEENLQRLREKGFLERLLRQ
ncbi:MAG: hypothetical protein PVG49_14140 [Desulfobacteraceae bacterium]|jgi:hypothetical protein